VTASVFFSRSYLPANPDSAAIRRAERLAREYWYEGLRARGGKPLGEVTVRREMIDDRDCFVVEGPAERSPTDRYGQVDAP